MTWLGDHLDLVIQYLLTHAVLAAVPTVVGLLLAIPLGWLAHRVPALRTPLVTGAGVLYTIPSLALFVLMPPVLGTKMLDPLNVVIALTIFSVALLVRTVADALGTVDRTTITAATAMGMGGFRRFVTVELPLAVPVTSAGLRVAAVSNVSIVSVAALIGVDQLGSLFVDGFNRAYLDPIIVGIVACVLLALAFDAVIVAVTWLITPWRHPGSSRRSVGREALADRGIR